MFIKTQMGDIINTDKIEKITYDKMLNNKWILAAVRRPHFKCDLLEERK